MAGFVLGLLAGPPANLAKNKMETPVNDIACMKACNQSNAQLYFNTSQIFQKYPFNIINIYFEEISVSSLSVCPVFTVSLPS